MMPSLISIPVRRSFTRINSAWCACCMARTCLPQCLQSSPLVGSSVLMSPILLSQVSRSQVFKNVDQLRDLEEPPGTRFVSELPVRPDVVNADSKRLHPGTNRPLARDLHHLARGRRKVEVADEQEAEMRAVDADGMRAEPIERAAK